jgi:hypothetical protein
MYDEHKVEDLDTDGEDHIADETRYMCMKHVIKPVKAEKPDEYYQTQFYHALNIPKENLVDYDDEVFDFTVKEIKDAK